MAGRQLMFGESCGSRRPANTLRALIEEGVHEYEEMLQARQDEERIERRVRSEEAALAFGMLMLTRWVQHRAPALAPSLSRALTRTVRPLGHVAFCLRHPLRT